MQKLILSLVFVAIATIAFGQSKDRAAQINTAVEEATALYNLTPEQVVKMEKIQTRHYKNLADVESLRKTDINKYVQKVENAHNGTAASMRMMLTEEQKKTMFDKQMELRIAKSDLIKEMKVLGATDLEIKMAIIQKLY